MQGRIQEDEAYISNSLFPPYLSPPLMSSLALSQAKSIKFYWVHIIPYHSLLFGGLTFVTMNREY